MKEKRKHCSTTLTWVVNVIREWKLSSKLNVLIPQKLTQAIGKNNTFLEFMRKHVERQACL